jgi:anhydro-N-acetylmuramic acid kinase
MKKINIIGLMSGTSLDGVDLAYAQFWFDNKWHFEIIACKTYEYELIIKEQLEQAFVLTGLQLAQLNVDLGRKMGNLINDFCDSYTIDKKSIDAIASHGHTIFHQPKRFLTLQIGCGAQIAAVTGLQTICDFRTLDVGLGGQGAPLVPIGDGLLFEEYDFCLNIGGIANVSFQKDDARLSYDICLANMVSNYLANQLGYEYDKSGDLARKGSFNNDLFNQMNSYDYFTQSYPKSLGKEFFDTEFKPLLDSYSISVEDKLHTFGNHFVQQLSTVLIKGSVLITGGGAFNSFWIEGLKKDNSQLSIAKPSNELINFKEALLFGFLGALRLTNQTNTLASVTGASKNSIGGAIYLG